MGFLILAIAIVVVLLALIALFSRTSTREPQRPSAPFPFKLGPAQLHELARAILASRGLHVDAEQTLGDRGSELEAHDATPVVGGRVHVRTLPGPPTDSAEVLAALDLVKGEGLHKILLLAPNGFSDEARLAAMDSAVELVDGPRLLELSRTAVDMGALREGRVVPRPETVLRSQQMMVAGTPAESHP
jgi:restriction system protein